MIVKSTLAVNGYVFPKAIICRKSDSSSYSGFQFLEAFTGFLFHKIEITRKSTGMSPAESTLILRSMVL